MEQINDGIRKEDYMPAHKCARIVYQNGKRVLQAVMLPDMMVLASKEFDGTTNELEIKKEIPAFLAAIA
jgi:hypothetical protein